VITIPGLLGSTSSCYEAAPRARGAKLRPVVTDVAGSVCVCEPYSRWGPVFPQGKDIFKGALPYDAAFCPNSLTFTACYNLETALF